MAANIETFTNGQSAFFAARQPAWHNLGTVTPDAVTASEALEISHLGGWNVRKSPLTTTILDETGVHLVDVPNKFATVRTNPVTSLPEALGVVGNRYEIVQNEQAFEVLNNIVDESGAHFETAGSLGHGEKVFVTLSLPEEIKIAGEDAHNLFLLATNTHDGSGAMTLAVTPVRVVCQNTLNVALKGAKQRFNIRHTANATSRIDEARQALAITWKYADTFAAEVEHLLDVEVSNAKFEAIIGNVFPERDLVGKRANSSAKRDEDQRDVLRYLFNESPTNAFGRGTAYAAFNALTEYADWYAPIKGSDRDGAKRAERNLSGVGPTAALKNNALSLVAA